MGGQKNSKRPTSATHNQRDNKMSKRNKKTCQSWNER